MAAITHPLPVVNRRPVSLMPPIKGQHATQAQGLLVNTKKGEVNKAQAQSPIIAALKGDALTEGQLIDIKEESPQGGGPVVGTKKESVPLQGLALRLKGLDVSPRESGTDTKGRPSNNKQLGSKLRGQASKAKVSTATATTKQSTAQVQRPSATQKAGGKDSAQSDQLNSQQESRLKTLSMTSDEALRFACPWDMYLQHDGKSCTDVSCPFNHTSSGNLEYKPLMCPFWGGKGGKHARCTKPANVCKLAHFECGHKQYGALPPGWVVRK